MTIGAGLTAAATPDATSSMADNNGGVPEDEPRGGSFCGPGFRAMAVAKLITRTSRGGIDRKVILHLPRGVRPSGNARPVRRSEHAIPAPAPLMERTVRQAPR
jgi:hypothetical protein